MKHEHEHTYIPLPSLTRHHRTARPGPFLSVLLGALAGLVLYYLQPALLRRPATPITFLEDLDRCAQHSIRPQVPFPSPRRTNPRAAAHERLVLRNVTVIDGDGQILGEKDITVEHGTIRTISASGLSDVQAWSTSKSVDAGGKYLSPGIIGEFATTSKWLSRQICIPILDFGLYQNTTSNWMLMTSLDRSRPR